MALRDRLAALLARQATEYDRMVDRQQRTVLAAYDDARRALLERLRSVTASGPYAFHTLKAQVETGALDLRGRLGAALSGVERVSHANAERHLLTLLALADRPPPGPALAHGLTGRLAAVRALASYQPGVDGFGAQILEAAIRELAAGAAEGLAASRLAQRIAAPQDSVMAGMRHRADLRAQMEASRAYNEAVLEGLREANALDPRTHDPLMKRIEETIDARNHPFSRVADGRTALPDEVFRVPISQVRATAKAMGRKTAGGIVWRLDGRGNWAGLCLPAHYRERGRVVPWRASWEVEPPV